MENKKQLTDDSLTKATGGKLEYNLDHGNLDTDMEPKEGKLFEYDEFGNPIKIEPDNNL